MTTKERLAELTVLRNEFNTEATTEDRRKEILTKVREYANEEMPESKCKWCGQTGFYADYHKALIPGHCYTLDGVRDYTNITKVCEFCFDDAFANEFPEED